MTTQAPLHAPEQSLFEAGAYRGHTAYVTVRKQQGPLTPQSLAEMMLQITLDSEYPPVWHAGFLAGWYTAMCQTGDTTRVSADALLTTSEVTT